MDTRTDISRRKCHPYEACDFQPIDAPQVPIAPILGRYGLYICPT